MLDIKKPTNVIHVLAYSGTSQINLASCGDRSVTPVLHRPLHSACRRRSRNAKAESTLHTQDVEDWRQKADAE
jgi:hypothetical protein